MGAPGDSAPHGGQLQALRICQEQDLPEAAGGTRLGAPETRGPAKREVQAELGRWGGGEGTGLGVRWNGGGAGGGPGPGAGQAAIESGRAGGRRAQSQRESQQAGTGAPRQSWARQVGLACGAAVTAHLF